MKNKRLVIPCLKGKIGTWNTYTCMMRLSDIDELVGFAHDIHKIDALSQQIQRKLKKERGVEIADYLLENEDRFFNSIVLAIYEGDPCWHEISSIRPNSEEALHLDFPDYAENCAGFLSVSRNEKLFALDGQHRVEGIKKACKRDPSIGDELLSVIIVKHESSKEGIRQTRRLFTTLNKKAEKVSEDAIIALDDEDISACITRELIESSHFTHFKESNVSFSSKQIHPTDKSNITTISNIYKNVKKLVSGFLGIKISDLDHHKIESRAEVFDFVFKFFNYTFFHCDELRSVTSNMEPVVKYRNKGEGGHLLFRPIGWDIYVDLVVSKFETEEIALEHIIKNILSKDLYLNGSIFEGTLWSSSKGRLQDLTSSRMRTVKNKLYTSA
ncbi:DGQHR domain-containing protein [Psychrobium sp. MM17-31]|uniref:DGQHR domain-containing protein n=1 Tax=Psychrobium sp. MM17-31 TaxID=2917758 RepID=UPI001EF564D1|nr:DNA sulfur modification protein DndB [Psychrobium sp. MM17-31]MCG7532636.1 DGQHR domain-containing protein [Psychrobium sp. MM17-31]